MKKHKGIWIIVLLLLWWIGGYLISIPVMALYSVQQQSLWRPALKVTMPGGWSTLEKDWYPIVLTSGNSSVSRVLNQDARMVVHYSFGALDGVHSKIYDKDSKYFLSFYGCYIISLDDDPRVLYKEDGTWDEKLLQRIPNYDLDVLVLSSLGCFDTNSSYEITDRKSGIAVAGFDDWTRFDAKVHTNSPDHDWSRFHPAYFQYGFPLGNAEEDFPKVDLNGRMYARYFEDESLYVMFFIIGEEEDFIQETDERFIQRSVVTPR